jgi:hypothetical protein
MCVCVCVCVDKVPMNIPRDSDDNNLHLFGLYTISYVTDTVAITRFWKQSDCKLTLFTDLLRAG